MTVKVLKPGLATTVQDLGRPGHFHLGIPVGGAMDRLAFRAANLLVGNEESAAGLEAVFLGPELEFERHTRIAITGADMPILLDGEEQPAWTTLEIRAGQVLSFGYLRAGARIYIAVAGGIDVPVVLGSRSTYLVGEMGGFEGRAIQAGDRLPVGAPGAGKAGRTVPDSLRRMPGNPAELRAMPGLYWHRITEAAGRHFFEDEWTVAPEADRMGYRFRGGRPMEFVEREQPFGAGADPSNIVDSSYAYGSIQIPGGSEPIVLHRDAVSAGGYFQIGAVISADMDLIGQMQPNLPTRFVQVDMKAALAARAERGTLMAQIREALA
ncbi:MAG: biotin-dependent carboxyltransferase family protein [Pseudomonadota bacterium]|nr:biotin-dependent carboxyltransferase family protein [Pseudomonadota bacterium]